MMWVGHSSCCVLLASFIPLPTCKVPKTPEHRERAWSTSLVRGCSLVSTAVTVTPYPDLHLCVVSPCFWGSSSGALFNIPPPPGTVSELIVGREITPVPSVWSEVSRRLNWKKEVGEKKPSKPPSEVRADMSARKYLCGDTVTRGTPGDLSFLY